MKVPLAVHICVCLAVSRGLAGQCTVGAPAQFAPPGGAASYGPKLKFTTGFATGFDLFEAQGQHKLLMRENYGYTIYDLADPGDPRNPQFCDIEGTYPRVGDFFDTVINVGAASDGSRLLVSYREPHGNLVLAPQAGSPGCDYNFAGEFAPAHGVGEAIVHVGSRYLGFGVIGNREPGVSVADVTTLLSGSAAQQPGSIPNELVPGTPGTPVGQSAATLADTWIVYRSLDSVVAIDAANPGEVGSISSGLRVFAYTASELGFPAGDLITSVAAAVHPVDGKLYVMAGGLDPATFLSDGYVLGSIDAAGAFTPSGGRYVPPAPWIVSGNATAIAGSEDVLFFAWNQERDAYQHQKLLTLTARTWPVDQSPAAVFDRFGSGSWLRALPVGTDRFELYTAVFSGAFAQSVACAPPVAQRFYPLAPCRLLDTRDSTGPSAAAPPLAAGEIRSRALVKSCGVPASARALAVNLVAVDPAEGGYLTLFPGDLPDPPSTSSLTFRAGQTRANNGIVSLSRDGSGTTKILNGSSGSTHFVLDVSGYYQ